jgi:serine/threonine protein kinase
MLTIDIAKCKGQIVPLCTPDEKFLLKDFIGKGGEGLVYAASNVDNRDSDVVVKILPLYNHSSCQISSEIMRHHRRLMQLNHPNIVQITDLQIDQHYLYIVMVIF